MADTERLSQRIQAALTSGHIQDYIPEQEVPQEKIDPQENIELAKQELK